MKPFETVWGWLNGTAIHKSIVDLPETEEIRRFARTFKPESGVDYGWFLEHSVKEFDFVEGRTKILEEKADRIVGYLGAVEGILAFGMAYIVSAGRGHLMWVTVPTLLSLLVAILLALASRSPMLHPAFPSTQEFLEKHPTGNPAKFAARVAATAKIARLANANKARLVRRSHLFLALGIVWFVLAALIYSVAR